MRAAGRLPCRWSSEDVFETLSFRLTPVSHKATTRKAAAKRTKGGLDAAPPSGRFGDIGRTIVEVLADAGTEMRLRDLHLEVEHRLGGPVSFAVSHATPQPKQGILSR